MAKGRNKNGTFAKGNKCAGEMDGSRSYKAW